MTKEERKESKRLRALLDKIDKDYPHFSFERDNDGQVLIYTNIFELEKGQLVDGPPDELC